MLAACLASGSWAQGGSISGKIAEYNAAQVRDNNGLVTVPSGMIAYTANSAIPVGNFIDVTLPAGFKFEPEIQLSLTDTPATPPTPPATTASLLLVSASGSKARFVVATSGVNVSDVLTLGSYTINAKPLETITPTAIALPLSIQAIGIDAQPASVPAFASDSGIQAVFVGAIQFIDLRPPSNGSEFFGQVNNQPADVPLAVLSAVAISPEIVDVVDQKTPILGVDGNPNKLASYDTATVELPGVLYDNVTVFSSLTSQCTSIYSPGKVTPHALIFPNIPFGPEVFFCAKAASSKMMKLIGYPAGGFITGMSPGFTTVRLVPTHPYDDYLSSANVNDEYSGNMCYDYGETGTCQNVYFNQSNLNSNAMNQ
jgi:hypothetical protein